MDDLHVADMAQYMSYLHPMPPTTARLDRWGTRCRSQKIHMIGWFVAQEQANGGAYGRTSPNVSAKMAYNRLANPGALLWIADAFGESEEAMEEAVRATIAQEQTNKRRRCAAFRAVIPWARIVALLDNPALWRYDPPLIPLLYVDQSGYPEIQTGCEAEYYKKINQEWDG